MTQQRTGTSESGGGAAPTAPIRLLMIGNSGVGKTSLMTRFADETAFTLNMISTAGVDCRVKHCVVNDQRVTLQIWDTAGQERFKTITRQYYRGAMGIMLVFDCTSALSFQHIEYWMSNIQQYAPQQVCRILVGNKVDMTDKREVSRADAEALAAHYGIPYIEASAKENTGVHDAYIRLVQDILPQLHLLNGQMIPASSAQAIRLAKEKQKREQEAANKQRCSGCSGAGASAGTT